MVQHLGRLVLVVAVLVAGCTASSPHAGGRVVANATPSTSTSTSTWISEPPTTTSAPATTSPVPTTHVSAIRPVVRVTTPSTAAAAPLLVERLHGLGAATQVVTVTSPSWGTDVATLQAFEKDGSSWRTVVGPTTAFIGVNGFASDKREGDGRTPVGTYGFGIMFGTAPNPGVRFAYRQAGPPDVWVDDPASSLYNTWEENPAGGRWSSAESLDQPAPYPYAAQIAYNTARVPGKGSAIFLHVSLGHGTAGCVAVAEPVLLSVLRWLDPARGPVIAMGPQSALM